MACGTLEASSPVLYFKINVSFDHVSRLIPASLLPQRLEQGFADQPVNPVLHHIEKLLSSFRLSLRTGLEIAVG